MLDFTCWISPSRAIDNESIVSGYKGSLAAAIASVVAMPGLAQQGVGVGDATEPLQEIVVTGSRIARPKLESTTPNTIVGAHR